VGTLIVLLLFIIGTVFVVSVIGKIASVFVNLKMGEKKPEKLKDHIAICNWNDRSDLIIKEIHSNLAAPKTEIIVITEKRINEQELRSNPAYEKVYLLRKEPTSHEVLEEARAHLAKSVIILADRGSKDPDAKTALISLAIGKLKKGLQEKAVAQKKVFSQKKPDSQEKPHIIAEVTSHQKIQHLKDAGVTEWICCTDYGLGIIAQCALNAKLSKVYEELLEYSEKNNEIYLVDRGQYPNSLKGKTFEQLSGIMNDEKDSQNPAILLGVKRGDEIILNPKGEKFDKFKEGDSLIVMAYKQPDLSHLENK
jgi:voltage-gated potassium channel